MKKIIKICGIRDPLTAKKAIELGADWVGLIFHKPSKRYVDLEQAQKVAKTTLEAGGTPVAVFVNHKASDMQAICEAIDVNKIQLHGEKSRKEHVLLSDDIQRIYVKTPDQINDTVRGLDPKRDFILFDYPEAGSGQTFDWSSFKSDDSFRWILAGGLNPSNVKEAIEKLNPFGVDVSTGVENEKGEKDIQKIRQFIEQVCYAK